MSINSLFSCCSGQDHAQIHTVRADVQDHNLCGVGINFKPDATGALAVHSLVAGSPASEDRHILPGDLLEQVDSQNVFRFSMDKVASRLLGPAGTQVVLTFQRRADGTAGGAHIRVQRTLRRVDVRALRLRSPQESQIDEEAAVPLSPPPHSKSQPLPPPPPPRTGERGGGASVDTTPRPSGQSVSDKPQTLDSALLTPPLEVGSVGPRHSAGTAGGQVSGDEGEEMLARAKEAAAANDVDRAQELYIAALRRDPQ